ncbi:hypothetical protein T492DRAFT_884686, partial [Pavlovales sp. CCMP2436]
SASEPASVPTTDPTAVASAVTAAEPTAVASAKPTAIAATAKSAAAIAAAAIAAATNPPIAVDVAAQNAATPGATPVLVDAAAQNVTVDNLDSVLVTNVVIASAIVLATLATFAYRKRRYGYVLYQSKKVIPTSVMVDYGHVAMDAVEVREIAARPVELVAAQLPDTSSTSSAAV